MHRTGKGSDLDLSDTQRLIPRRNLRLREAAEIIGYSHRYLLKMLADPEKFEHILSNLPPFTKLGSRYVIYGPTLEAWLIRQDRDAVNPEWRR